MKYCLMVILLGMTLACKQEVEMPIPEEKMAVILKEMLIAEAAMNRVGRSMKDSIQELYYQQIYQIHEIDSLELAESFKMMQDHPELSMSVYKKAEELLGDMEQKQK